MEMPAGIILHPGKDTSLLENAQTFLTGKLRSQSKISTLQNPLVVREFLYFVRQIPAADT
jgi:hypothetical protein